MVTITRRIFASVAWVIGSMLLWAIPCNLLFFGIEYSERHGVHIPSGVDTALSVVPATGMLIIMPVVAVLALRGKLPWTGTQQEIDDAGVSPDTEGE
jgi:hypothetical protein